MAQVQLICGAQRSQRTAHIDRLFKEAQGRALLLTPTQAYALHRRDQLFAGGEAGAWGEPVRSFTAFVRALLSRELGPLRELSAFERSLLLSHCLKALNAQSQRAHLLDRPGVVQHLLGVINGLKQAAVDPADFERRMATTATPIDQLVATIYRAYQEALRQGGLYDIPGLYWAADLMCRQRRPRLLIGIDTVLLDGFDDFTPSELRLLEGLRPHLKRMAFGLNYDEDPARSDLYAISAETCAQLQQRFEARRISIESPPAQSISAYCADTLFWRNPPAEPTGLRKDMRILPCIDAEHEREVIARQIKRLIVEEGVSTESIAVVFRNLQENAAPLYTVFEHYGLPIQGSRQSPLAESSLAATLLRLFEAIDRWSRDSVVACLASPWLRGVLESPPALTAHIALLARTAQIIRGRQEWLERLAQLHQRIKKGQDLHIERILQRLPEAWTLTEALQAAVARLITLTQGFGGRARQAEFAFRIDTLLTEVWEGADLSAAVQGEEADALAALREILESLVDYEQEEELLSWEEFKKRFEQGVRRASFSRGGGSGIVLLDAATARNQSYEYVFVGGLIEGACPAPPAANAIYREEDVLRLAQAGIVLDDQGRHSARERLLFHHQLSMAEKALVLTWPMQRGQKAETRRSPYLSELIELFPPGALEAEPPGAAQVVPSSAWIASRRDVRNAVLYGAVRIPKATEVLSDAVLRGAALEARRYESTPFDPYDGRLENPALISRLAERFGADHQFSVNQLEQYLQCSFRFFTDRLLGVLPYEPPEEAFDPRVRGLILHSVLEAFHRQHADVPASELDTPEVRDHMLACLEKVFADIAWRSVSAPKGVIEAEKGHMRARLLRYLAIEASRKSKKDWRPWVFEVSFGRSQEAAESGWDKPEPLRLALEDGPLQIGGRIDRIDRLAEDAENEVSPRLRLVDYKSGKLPEAGDIIEGRSLQMTIYTWALEQHLFPGSRCLEAHFLAVGKKKWQEALGLENNRGDWEARVELAEAAILMAVRGMRTGWFSPTPAKDACTYCPYRQACRYEQNRIERKVNAPREAQAK